MKTVLFALALCLGLAACSDNRSASWGKDFWEKNQRDFPGGDGGGAAGGGGK